MESALGASLSYFSNTGEALELSSDNSKVVGIFYIQIGAKLSFKQLPLFHTYSFFSEIAFALIPSDVTGAPGVETKIGFGLRIGIF